jgi:hypothetical protein
MIRGRMVTHDQNGGALLFAGNKPDSGQLLDRA